jgi:hypothetical protein
MFCQTLRRAMILKRLSLSFISAGFVAESVGSLHSVMMRVRHIYPAKVVP